jgi:S-(hydroxymethyl)glutathione dehydrogenase/alcohol dehydrogenase
VCSLGNLAEYVVCPSIHVFPIPRDIPLRAAALLGCGATCGVGAALNTAKVRPGSTVAVFGCGGAGIATIQGARIAGAARIFAVDVSDNKLELAKRFGATHVARADDAVQELLRQTSGIGVDYAFEAVGVPSVVETAYSVTRRGGMTAVLGVGKLTDNVKINALGLPMLGKTLVGSLFGSVNAQVDFPKMLGLYQAGKLDLEGMISRTYTLDQAVQALEDTEHGKNVRSMVVMS